MTYTPAAHTPYPWRNNEAPALDAANLTDAEMGTAATAAAGDQSVIDYLSTGAPINVMRFGAKCDGVTLDDAAMAAVVASLPSVGGKILVPGRMMLSDPLILDGLRALTIEGLGGVTAGGTPASQIAFTQSGSASALSLRSTTGVTLRDVSVISTNTSFTGSLIDFSHNGGGGADSAFMTIENAFLFAYATCPRLLDLHQAISGNYRNVYFNGADRAVRGQANVVGTYSNGHQFDACTFSGSLDVPVLSPGQGWEFAVPVVESLSGGTAGFITWGAGTVPMGIDVHGGWFGDASNVGNWITFAVAGAGVSIRGNYFSKSDAAILISGKLTGAEIVGNKFDLCNYGVEIGVNCDDLVIMANDDSSCNTSGLDLAGGLSFGGASIICDGKAGTANMYGIVVH